MNLSYQKLEFLYAKYNRFSYIHPDPLEFIYKYQEKHDMEIVGLLASALAYGNVKQILKSVSTVLNKMGTSPCDYISGNTNESFLKDFTGFKHRFTTCEDLTKLLMGVKSVLSEYGSLQDCFVKSLSCANDDFASAVSVFAGDLNKHSKNGRSYLVPSPGNGSACKRLMLYFRWMVRSDEVDPGCWSNTISPSKLIVPLDIHMFNISREFGFTIRKSADFKTATEITKKFSVINPFDPVKYDFVLTRFGIRDDLTYKDL